MYHDLGVNELRLARRGEADRGGSHQDDRSGEGSERAAAYTRGVRVGHYGSLG